MRRCEACEGAGEWGAAARGGGAAGPRWVALEASRLHDLGQAGDDRRAAAPYEKLEQLQQLEPELLRLLCDVGPADATGERGHDVGEGGLERIGGQRLENLRRQRDRQLAAPFDRIGERLEQRHAQAAVPQREEDVVGVAG